MISNVDIGGLRSAPPLPLNTAEAPNTAFRTMVGLTRPPPPRPDSPPANSTVAVS